MPKRPAYISAPSAQRSHACSYVASRTSCIARLAICSSFATEPYLRKRSISAHCRFGRGVPTPQPRRGELSSGGVDVWVVFRFANGVLAYAGGLLATFEPTWSTTGGAGWFVDRRTHRVWHRQVVAGRQTRGSGAYRCERPECGCCTSQRYPDESHVRPRIRRRLVLRRRELVFTDSSGNVRRRVFGKNDDELPLANGIAIIRRTGRPTARRFS